MKNIFLLSACWLSISIAAQTKEAYYDYFWNPCSANNARFYSITEKTDSGWLREDYFVFEKRLQMQALYEDEACNMNNGNMYYFHSNGNPSQVGRMVHGKREGVCVSYYFNGVMADSASFHNNVPVGSRMMWHRNGYMSDSIYHINDSTDVHIQWSDAGTPEGGGYEVNGKPDGKWTYYHNNGKLAGEVIYSKGKITSCNYFNEDGSPQPDTAKANSSARFKKGGDRGWASYLQKSLYWPHGLSFSVDGSVTVGVSFTINEEGKVEDAAVYIPFHPEFDKIALKIVKNSPDWLPAVNKNRRVKQYIRQPVTFLQEQEE